MDRAPAVRTFHHIVARALAFGASAHLAACAEPAAPDTSTLPVASIAITPDTVSLLGGESLTLSVRLSDSLGNVIRGRSVRWTIDDSTVGAIRATGDSANVMGLFTGMATITAVSESKEASATLVVRLVFASVSAGDAAAPCATTPEQGAAFCWGNNHGGRLGALSPDRPECSYSPCSTRPVVVPGGVRFAAVSASTFGSCGLSTNGQVHCWGDSAGVFRFWTVASVHSFIEISAGEGHYCAIATDRTAHCWGDNSRGQLGDGRGLDQNVPRPISGGRRFQTVSAGMRHTCGVTTTGAAYCWGSGVYGNLGHGSFDDAATPVAVAGGHTFASISAGVDYTCGVTTAGEAYCWGLDTAGQLGGTIRGDWAVPVRAASGITFSIVSTATNHTCGVTPDGTGYCWGDNGLGQLGDGTTIHSTAAVEVAGDLSFAMISAGRTHSCAVTTAGVAYCWGSGAQGQLGNGSTLPSYVPVRVGGQP